MNSKDLEVIQSVTEEAASICRAALEVMQDWKFETNLQFPTLVERVAVKLNITDNSRIKELDGQIRFFVHRHPDYRSKRGAHGGVALASVESQREAVRAARAAGKAEAAARVGVSESENSEQAAE